MKELLFERSLVNKNVANGHLATSHPTQSLCNSTEQALYTLNYQACVAFYAQIRELPKLFETESLTCFAFGKSYLMVEIDDQYEGQPPEKERIRTCLRMNVPNVKKWANLLISKQIKVDYQEHSWGTVAKFFDPDGNLCALKDSEKFEQQIAEHKAEGE